MKLTIIAIALLISAVSALESCTTTIGGNTWNLTALENQNYTKWTDDQGHYDFYFNLCNPLDATLIDICKDKGDGAAGLQASSSEGNCWLLGKTDNPVWSLYDPSDPSKGIIVTFDGGEMCSQGMPRTIGLNLTCDNTKTPENPGTPDAVHEDDYCAYTVHWPSYYGCPVQTGPTPTPLAISPTPTSPPGPGPSATPTPIPSALPSASPSAQPPVPTHHPSPTPGPTPGPSGGTIFLVVVLVCSVVYCGGGIAYKRSQYGTSWSESIPNVDMWRGCGRNVQNGCRRVFGGKPQGEYTQAPNQYQSFA